jgi:hypothetical protein
VNQRKQVWPKSTPGPDIIGQPSAMTSSRAAGICAPSLARRKTDRLDVTSRQPGFRLQ